MSSVLFIHGDPVIRSYGLSSTGEYTPVIMVKDGKRFFIRNIVLPLKGDAYSKLNHQKSIDDAERAKAQLIETDGKFCCFYSRENDPFKFLDWVKENNYTIEIHGELFEPGQDFTDFHGNLCEYSAAFMYRIYDPEMLNSIKEIVKEIPQNKCY
ncbi:MAG: hypothetical protein HPY66_1677 [Firmicutes bacterium]|nr:hypothetical protein [Bacillota bacterium]